MMRLIKHIADVIWVRLWAWLGKHGVGDPLNQLLLVPPYPVVPREPKVRVTRYRLEPDKPQTRSKAQKALRKLVESEFVDERRAKLKLDSREGGDGTMA